MIDLYAQGEIVSVWSVGLPIHVHFTLLEDSLGTLELATLDGREER